MKAFIDHDGGMVRVSVGSIDAADLPALDEHFRTIGPEYVVIEDTHGEMDGYTDYAGYDIEPEGSDAIVVFKWA